MNTAFAHAALTPRSHVGRYEILTKLAAGGMAEVYAARVQGSLGFSRLLALKLLYANLVHEEQFLTMFLDEARLAARIHHPNVAATLDVGDASGVPFLVMEYIEGDHLGQLLAKSGALGEHLPMSAALRIVSDALNGLGAAHALCDEQGQSLNVVHRDISPHNIMVGCDGVARLTDFGVAKAEDRLTHTRTGIVKGKISYMAPEQASTGQVDSRSDLFAMGVVLWESVTGRRLFRGENATHTLKLILHEQIPAPSSVDAALAPLDELLARALHRDPDQRFQTADAFANEVEHVAACVGGLSPRRAVGALVERLAQERLERDRAMIVAASNGEVAAPSEASPPASGRSAGELDALVRSVEAQSAKTRPRMFVARDGDGAPQALQSAPPSPSSLPSPPLTGSLLAPAKAPAGHTLRTLGARLAVLLVGLLAFVAMLWLTAEAPPDVTRAGFITVGPAPSLSSSREATSMAHVPVVESANEVDRITDTAEVQALSSTPAPEEMLVDDHEAPEGTTTTAIVNEGVMRRATRRRAEDFPLYENPYLRDAVEEASAASGQLAPMEQPSLAAPEEPQVPAAP